MNSSLKSFLFTIVGVIIFFAVASLFISLIPYLIVAGLVIYIIVKIKKTFRRKASSDYNEFNSKININTHNSEGAYTSADENLNGKIIDVEYKDVQE